VLERQQSSNSTGRQPSHAIAAGHWRRPRRLRRRVAAVLHVVVASLRRHEPEASEVSRITFEDFHVTRAPFDDATVLRGPIVRDDGTVTAGVVLIVPDGIAVRGPNGEMTRWGWRVVSWPPALSVATSPPDAIRTLSLAELSRYVQERGQSPKWLQQQVAARLEALLPDNDDPPPLARAKHQRHLELSGQAAAAWGHEQTNPELLPLG
jgi:hypothetical protein